MIFVEEKQLRDAFWKKYNYRKNILKYQFESNARHGGVDLITVETVERPEGDSIVTFIGWEFKLSDIKKAIAQAELSLEFCHKVFVVIPLEKRKIIEEKYLQYLEDKKYIGVIGVELDGRWTMIYQPWMQKDDNIKINQEILKLLGGVL
ncbi:MAG: hypothetical protein MR601_04590 [Erysipelotrichaceae bacterium]|nr:hypothetical protein [Erysipelotrichaceae bacterium]